ncbi:FAD-dependent oxidoreductase [Desulfobacterales bacterium HSG17]|nr:FAD-dependent oxidoreductase [Desulfobacterales bacterium HSG17]
MKYVIIGNGVAGIKGAEAIRKIDSKGSITMIADESVPPYCRPMISMVLEGAVPFSKLSIRNPTFYDDLKITPVLGKRVSDIDVDNKLVYIPDNRNTKGKTSIPFDKLLIAAGADPRPVKTQGVDLGNIFYMRTQDHVRKMLDVLPDLKNALVLGGGLVAFKAAYGLMSRGKNVTMLIKSEYPLSMQVDDIAGKIIMDELVSKGLKVRAGIEVTAFGGNKNVKTAYLSDGTRIECDMVVIGKGVLPALSFIPQDKIKVDLGIMVDEHMETGVPGIFAAGDVAEYTDIARQDYWVNAIWPEAVAQGHIAGINMAGRPLAYKGSLSRNVIRIFDMDIMTGGLIDPDNDYSWVIASAKDKAYKTYKKLVFRNDKLVGMVMVNDIEQGGILLSLIQSQMPVKISKNKLLSPSFNYKQII